jgi:hypothetical protein
VEATVNHRDLLFFIALGLFLVALLVVAGYAYVHSSRRRRRVYGDWKSLIQRFTLVDRDSVARIAMDFISCAGFPEDIEGSVAIAKDEEELDPQSIWPLIGGLDGLEVLQSNCAVLVDMAFYVQQWYPQALAVAEQLRLNAREIEWHVERLKGAAKTGKLEAAFPDYAQRAITTYYLMTRRVLALFEQADFPGLFDLQRAL